jgi:hypothetical protein
MDDSVIKERQKHEMPSFGATPQELNAAYRLSLRHTRGSERGIDPLPALLRPELMLLFVGQGRSGHGLIGALVDAHLDCLVSHEPSVCSLIAAGFDKDQIFHLIWENFRHFAKVRRAWGRHSHAVPSAHQGSFRKLRVIGDKNGGSTAEDLFKDPSNEERLATFFGVPLRFTHVVRNPLDCIAAMAMRAGAATSLDGTVANYARRCATCAPLLEVRPGDVLAIHYEDVSLAPDSELTMLVGWLGLSVGRSWLDACTRVARHCRAEALTRSHGRPLIGPPPIVSYPNMHS